MEDRFGSSETDVRAYPDHCYSWDRALGLEGFSLG